MKPVSKSSQESKASSSAHVNEVHNSDITVGSELNMHIAGIVQRKVQIEELCDCSAGSPKPRLPSQRGVIKV